MASLLKAFYLHGKKLAGIYYLAGMVGTTLSVLLCFIHTKSPWGGTFILAPFTDNDSEAEAGYIVGPGSQSQQIGKPNPGTLTLI